MRLRTALRVFVMALGLLATLLGGLFWGTCLCADGRTKFICERIYSSLERADMSTANSLCTKDAASRLGTIEVALGRVVYFRVVYATSGTLGSPTVVKLQVMRERGGTHYESLTSGMNWIDSVTVDFGPRRPVSLPPEI